MKGATKVKCRGTRHRRSCLKGKCRVEQRLVRFSRGPGDGWATRGFVSQAIWVLLGNVGVEVRGTTMSTTETNGAFPCHAHFMKCFFCREIPSRLQQNFQAACGLKTAELCALFGPGLAGLLHTSQESEFWRPTSAPQQGERGKIVFQ